MSSFILASEFFENTRKKILFSKYRRDYPLKFKKSTWKPKFYNIFFIR